MKRTLIGDDLTKLNNTKKKWTKEIIFNRLKEKLSLLLPILSEEDKFVRKFINLIERYNSELEWEVAEMESYEKELEEKITWYKQNPEQFLSVSIFQLLETNFPTKEPRDLKLVTEEILKSTIALRQMLDWNKRWEIKKDVRNKVWITCYRGLDKDTKIVDSIINILEQKEEEIQEFNHRYKELFLNRG